MWIERTFTKWNALAAWTLLAFVLAIAAPALAAGKPDAITIDWATYNPVSLILKDKGWMEKEFANDGIPIKWVQSMGSDKALAAIKAGTADFTSSAGAAALLARINGTPVKSIYVYSKPEWTALVVLKDSPIRKVEDLRGKNVAVAKGTDPYIFLLRALAAHKMGETDIKTVPIGHLDGRLALENGVVDAWAGLDPMMADIEVTKGARLFFRNANLNTYGVLNTSEAFANAYPELVVRVLRVYDQARLYSADHKNDVRGALVAAARLTDPVASKQLERTDLKNADIAGAPEATIREAGVALQKAGIIAATVNVPNTVKQLIEPKFVAQVVGQKPKPAGKK